MDGIVFARSGFNHSINYRSVMALGSAEVIGDADLPRALEEFSERLAPGRWAEIRPPTGQELKATTVLRMKLEEVSAKVRTGPPNDDEDDYALPVWAGVLPLKLVRGEPLAAPRLKPGTPVPEAIAGFTLG
jgi:nitroimidazol reductase NimA-like FMN-containing flavoprotein (pyridoxamine 5'-phosphate oxidase superfamily)